MAETQKELFDEFQREKKGRKRFFRSPEAKPIFISSSWDALLLALLLLVMGGVLLYAAGVEVGRQGISILSMKMPKGKGEPKAEKEAPAVFPSPSPSSLPKAESLRKFTIQVASFNGLGTAERALETLRKESKGAELFLIGTDPVGVCVGNYETRAEADRALIELRKRYRDAFVRNR